MINRIPLGTGQLFSALFAIWKDFLDKRQALLSANNSQQGNCHESASL
jgi:hypothetical protein